MAQKKGTQFMDMPYDIRHLIYHHLFPSVGQIYIFADDNKLSIMDPEFPGTAEIRKNPLRKLPLSIFLVSRQIYQESAGHLYNRYLFNIVGTKDDCVRLYPYFLEAFKRHTRQEPRIDVFSNGDHSTTSCISVQAGNSHLNVLSSRRRGKPTTVEQLSREAAKAGRYHGAGYNGPASRFVSENVLLISAVLVVIVAALYVSLFR